MEKNKIDQDQIAMILADIDHGELTKCTCDCNNCPLGKELPIKIVGKQKVTICNMLCDMCTVLNEVEHD